MLIFMSMYTRIYMKYILSVLTLLSLGVCLPLPVFGRHVIEHCSSVNLPKSVQRHHTTSKKLESGPNWGPAAPTLCMAQDQN
jgi:hypothetical protein